MGDDAGDQAAPPLAREREAERQRHQHGNEQNPLRVNDGKDEAHQRGAEDYAQSVAEASRDAAQVGVKHAAEKGLLQYGSEDARKQDDLEFPPGIRGRRDADDRMRRLAAQTE